MDNRPSLIARLLAEYATTGRLSGFSGGDGSDDQDGGDDQTPAGNTNANPGGKEGETPNGNGFTPITSQADLDRIIGDRLKRDRKSIAKEVRDEIEAETRAEEAKRQGDFKKLLDDLQPKHEQLERDHESATTELAALRTYFDADYTAALKDLPEAITALAPEADEPFTVRSAWLTKARAAAKKLGTTTTHGNGPNPRPGGDETKIESPLSRRQIANA